MQKSPYDIDCKYSNEIFKQPRCTQEVHIQTTNAVVELVFIPQQKLQALTPKVHKPEIPNIDQSSAWSKIDYAHN